MEKSNVLICFAFFLLLILFIHSKGRELPTLPERFKVAFSLIEKASTGTLSGSEMAGALTLVLRVCTGILFESI